MPLDDAAVCRYAAEPPQGGPPTGAWADTLRGEFLAAVAGIDAGEVELGDPGELAWHPDRTLSNRTYVPVTAPTSTGLELFGYVAFTPAHDGAQPSELFASADFTDETAERHPEWRLDLCDEAVDSWRGADGAVAAMTLVWGRPLLDGGALVSAALEGTEVDSCAVLDGRFTLLAPDDFRETYLDVRLLDAGGAELAAESLYAE